MKAQNDAWHYNACIMRADSCFMAGDFAGASRTFDEAFSERDCVQGMHLYNSACAAALAGQNDVAFKRLHLRLAADPDWYADEPNADADLAPLHTDPRWQEYCDILTARRERIEANFDKPLRAQLKAIARADQDVRHEFLNAYRTEPRDQARIDSLIRVMQMTDSLNLKAVTQILDTRGFVGSDVVGNACGVFWLVIQHASVEMQRKYFPEFRAAAEHGDLSKEQLALMDDRIAMFEGRPQRYGTQIIEDENGKPQLYQLLDPDMVDTWRKEVGMPPLEDYLMKMNVK